MPRTRSLAWAELKIGLIAIFALTATAVLIFFIGGSGGFFWQNYTLKVVFADVATLKSGSPVRVAGVEVGSVTNVQFSGAGVEVWFTVSNTTRPLVTNQSVASIGSISLLGEGSVDITAAPAGTPVPEWGYVAAGDAEGIGKLTKVATAGLDEAKRFIEDLRMGKGTVGKLFTDDGLYREVERLIGAAQKVATSIADGRGSVGKLIRDPKLYDELQQSAANVNAIAARIRNGEGSIGQLMNDPAFAKTLTSTTQNLESVSAKLNRGEGTAGKLLTDDALYKRLDTMSGRLDTLVQQLNEGQGTAGQLLHDKQLYENMNQAASELRGLIGDIRKDPRKYLNVKVSIF